jgi:hypothetical protein
MNRTKEGFDPLEKRWGHFPLCPEFDVRPSWCICDRLEQVMEAARADERERIVHNVTAEWAEAVHEYRADLRARIQALPGAHLSGDAKGVVYRAAVLALLNEVRP